MANSGLILVDHIHFQYNGLLFGILLLSIARMLSGNFVQSAAFFVLLLNMKHIFLYSAPAYFIYLFATYCIPLTKVSKAKLLYMSHCNWAPLHSFSPYNSFIQGKSIINLLKLASTVLFGFLFSFGPFIYNGQLLIVLARLFPVKRGLTHAYWAPNVWAIYSFIDRSIAMLMKKLNPTLEISEGSTSGLVQQSDFAFLPNIPAYTTVIITILMWMPVLCQLWKKQNGKKFTN